MKIIALMAWYAESPTWLAASVASLSRFADHLVIADGAYRLYPDGRPSSGSAEHDAIIKAAEAVGMGITLHIPSQVYEDNEVEKRNLIFRLGEAVATPEEDWYFILDADEVVIEDPPNLREDLANTSLDVGSAQMVEHIDWHRNEQMEQVARAGFASSRTLAESRRFYRAIPGLRCVGNHYTFIAERDGKQLTLRGLDRFGVDGMVPTGVVLEHRSKQRDLERDHAKRSYYALRDATGAETAPDAHVVAP